MRFKKALSCILAVACICSPMSGMTGVVQINESFTAMADDDGYTLFDTGTYNNTIQWALYKKSDGRKVVFSGTGKLDMKVWSATGLSTMGASSLKAQKIENIVIGEGITEIAGLCDSLDGLTSIELPSTLTGSVSFRNCSNLKSIDLPDGITQILSMKGCTSLESITIPDSVEIIGDNSDPGSPEVGFKGCTSLKSVTLPKNSKFNTIYDFTFENCISLKSIVIPDNVVRINNRAFGNCTGLKSVTLSNRLVKLDNAFDGCSNLEELTLPDSLVNLELCGMSKLREITIPAKCINNNTPFADCPNLEAINVAPDNTKYYSVDGVWFEKAGTSADLGDKLRQYPPGKKSKSFVIPKGTISVNWFSENPYIETIVYPDGQYQTSISFDFDGCTNLQTVYIPENYISINWRNATLPSLVYIYGKSGSYAETFANQEGYVFIDGYPDIDDAPVTTTTTARTTTTTTTTTKRTTTTTKTTLSESASTTKVTTTTTKTSISPTTTMTSITVATTSPITIVNINDLENNTLTIKNHVPQKLINGESNTLWTSSNKDVCSIDSDGIITPVANGKSIIYGICAEKTYSCNVIIDIPPSGGTPYIYLHKINETKQLNISYYSGNVTWVSSDINVAIVDETGLVKAVGQGTAKVYAIFSNNERFEYTVRVATFNESLLNGYSFEEVKKSPIKPIISVSKNVISLSDKDKIQKVEITVNGDNVRYDDTCLHIFFDKRLRIKTDGKDVDLEISNPGIYLNAKYVADYDKNENMSFVVLTTSNAYNKKDNYQYGESGVMWTLYFYLPENAQFGDVYPIDIMSLNDTDHFNNYSEQYYNDYSRLSDHMSAYAFTYGIYNEVNPYPGDEYIPAGSTYDGYIAVEKDKREETTITTTSTQTSYSTTTTTVTNTDTTTESATTTTFASSGNIIASGMCGDNATWALDDSGTLVISGTGDMQARAHLYWKDYKILIKNVVINSGITNIGSFAFEECSLLSSIAIPNTVKTVGSNAFFKCSLLSSITIPYSIQTIGEGAFSGCSSLESITLPSSVSSIERSTFYNCSSLSSITIPASVLSIGDRAFYGCSNLLTITLPNSTLSMGDSSFSNCVKLKEVHLPNALIRIGNSAFSSCTNLSTITIPNSVLSIGSWAFSSCSNLNTVIIPDSVENIEVDAFANCGILSITILNSNCIIGESEKTIPKYKKENGKRDEVIIKGYEGSTAQAYAQKYNRPFIVLGNECELTLGDPNNDGKIDASDASFVLGIYAILSTGGKSGLTEEQENAADVNNDGKIDAKDASTILSYYSYTSTGGKDDIETFMKSN